MSEPWGKHAFKKRGNTATRMLLGPLLRPPDFNRWETANLLDELEADGITDRVEELPELAPENTIKVWQPCRDGRCVPTLGVQYNGTKMPCYLYEHFMQE